MIFYAINYLTGNTLPYILNMLLINLFGTKTLWNRIHLLTKVTVFAWENAVKR